MKLGKLGALLVSISLLGLTACTGNKSKSNKGTKTIDTHIIQKNSGSLIESAENLALSGEQLLSPLSFMYADLIFDMALKNDPSNKRAQFYKTILKPLVYMKGSMKRIKPLLPLFTKEEQKNYAEFVKDFPESAYKTFLLDGKEDLKNEKDVQAFLDGYRDQWEQVRIFMKESKEFNINLNVMTLPAMGEVLDKAYDECDVQQKDAGIFEAPINCKYLKALKVNVSRADIEVIQQIAAGMQMASILTTAYDLSGTRKLHETAKTENLTQKVIFENYRDTEGAGQLRNEELTKITKLGVDAVTGTRWALKNQRNLCLYGEENFRNRKGSLFKNGVCIDKVDSKSGKLTSTVLDIINKAATGGLVTISKDIYSDDPYVWEPIGEAKATIKPSAIFDNPTLDLKAMLPAAYNECDSAVSLNDPTVGGLFPNRDGNKYLRKTGELDAKKCL